MAILITGVVLLTLLTLSIWRRFHQTYVEKVFRMKVFEVRDQLRRLAINGEISTDAWVFRYFDIGFSNTLQQSYYITLVHVVTMKFRLESDPNYLAFKTRLDEELKKNTCLNKVISDYQRALHEYLGSQHYIGYHFFLKPSILFLIGARTASKKLQESISSTLYFPDNHNILSV